MQELKMTWTGTIPLLIHNEQLSVPLNKYTIALAALTSKRKKTLDDHWEISRLEWEAGLYLHEGIVQLPARMIRACIIAGAKMHKNGTKLKEGAIPLHDHFPLEYGSPILKTTNTNGTIPDPAFDKHWKQYAEQSSVKVGQSWVMRTRPKFNRWIVKVAFVFDENHITRAEMIQAAENAGTYKGLGSARPGLARRDSGVT